MDHQHLTILDGHDRHRARVLDDVPRVLAPIGIQDGVDAYGEVASGVDRADAMVVSTSCSSSMPGA